jgi:hypothetical protein
MRRSAVILSTLSAGALAADQQLRGSSGDTGNNKCLQNPQGDWTPPQGWDNDCSWMQCDGNGHNGDDCQRTDDSANQCRDWNLFIGNHDVCNIPAGNGHGKIFCFGDVKDQWEHDQLINNCQWLKNGDECGTDDNAQWCRDQNSHACPRQCPRGALTVAAPAALPVSKQAGNLTVELASDEGCCSFDGCETCAQWCTQQGKEVCLAPQGAHGGGCDNSHIDPHAHPPQWCPPGAGAKVPAALTANDALAAAASTTCGVLPQCAALSQTQPSQCPDAGSGNCKVNSAKMCIYNPKCVSGETSFGCVVDTGCQYVDTPSAACYGNGDFKSNDCGNSQFGCYPSKGCSDGTLSEQCAAGGQPQECRYCDKGGSPSAPGLVSCPAPAPAPVQLQSP